MGLSCEDVRLKIDDLLNLIWSWRLPLRVGLRSIYGLLRQIEVNRLKVALVVFQSFSSIPHHRTEIWNIRGRQRTAVGRDGGDAVATIRIFVIEDSEFSILRDLLLDADKALGQNEIVC